MWSGLELLKKLKKIEVFALFIAWFYLVIALIIVVVGSIGYALLMFDYWRIRTEPFPGLLILFCAVSIAIAIVIIYISFDMIHGIKHKNHLDVRKFRLFAFLCLTTSFLLLPLSLYNLSSITKWLFGQQFEMFKLPTADIILVILIYHMILYMIVDVIYDDYKKNEIFEEKQEQQEEKASVSSDSGSIGEIMIHVVEIH